MHLALAGGAPGVRAGAVLAAVAALDPAEPARSRCARRSARVRRNRAGAQRRRRAAGGPAARATATSCSARSTPCARASSTPPASGSTATSTSARRCGPAATSCSSTSRASRAARSASGRSSARRSPTSPGCVRSLDYAGRVALATSRRARPHRRRRRRAARALAAGVRRRRMQDRYWSTLHRRRCAPADGAGPADQPDPGRPRRRPAAPRRPRPAEGAVRGPLRAGQPPGLGHVAARRDRPDARRPRPDRDASDPRLGAVPVADGSTRLRGVGAATSTPSTFEVWAPRPAVTSRSPPARSASTGRPARGSAVVDGVGHGDRYRFRLDGGEPLADPASGWQPEGVHGPSAVVDAAALRVDRRRVDRRRPRTTPCCYELHVGTFTPGGTLDAAIDELDPPGPPRRHPDRADAAERRSRAPATGATTACSRRPCSTPTAGPRRWPASSTPPTRAGLGRRPRRRLQPRRAGGQRARPVRAVLHRRLPHAVGRCHQRRRGRAATPCDGRSSRAPAGGSRTSTSTGCGVDAIDTPSTTRRPVRSSRS